MINEPTPVEAQEAWTLAARAQGLVCQICCETPKLEDREAFFDTGVCADCATDKHNASPLTA
jgi:hypothetical protein